MHLPTDTTNWHYILHCKLFYKNINYFFFITTLIITLFHHSVKKQSNSTSFNFVQLKKKKKKRTNNQVPEVSLKASKSQLKLPVQAIFLFTWTSLSIETSRQPSSSIRSPPPPFPLREGVLYRARSCRLASINLFAIWKDVEIHKVHPCIPPLSRSIDLNTRNVAQWRRAAVPLCFAFGATPRNLSPSPSSSPSRLVFVGTRHRRGSVKISWLPRIRLLRCLPLASLSICHAAPIYRAVNIEAVYRSALSNRHDLPWTWRMNSLFFFSFFFFSPRYTGVREREREREGGCGFK